MQNGVEIGPVGERRPELLPCRCRSHGALGKVHCLNTDPDTAMSFPPAWQVKPRERAAVGSGSLVVGPRNEKSWRSGPCAALGLRADGRARFEPIAEHHVESVRRRVVDSLTDAEFEALSRITGKILAANSE